jgi:hypothetical protein
MLRDGLSNWAGVAPRLVLSESSGKGRSLIVPAEDGVPATAFTRNRRGRESVVTPACVGIRLPRDFQNRRVRTASKIERHFASDIPGRQRHSYFASAPASTKNRILNTPSWPKKRTAFRASSKVREGLGKANVMIDTLV